MISAITQASSQAPTTAPSTATSNTNTTNRLEQSFIDQQEYDQVHNTHEDPFNSKSLIELLDNFAPNKDVEYITIRENKFLQHCQDSYQRAWSRELNKVSTSVVSDCRNDGQVQAHLEDANDYTASEGYHKGSSGKHFDATTAASTSASHEPTFYAGEAQYCTTFHRDALWPI